MTGIHIRKRTLKNGERRYYCYYRLGGRGFKEQYGGAFTSLEAARERKNLIAVELAGGRDPQLLIRRTPAAPAPGLDPAWDVWARSKRKVGGSAQKLYANSKAWWTELLGADTDPAKVTVGMVSEGVDGMLDELAPATVRLYLSHLAMMLDFTLPDGAHNPARSKRIELPGSSARTPPPSNAEWTALLAHIADRSRTAVRLMECCALRVSEACGVEQGDLDAAQILVRRENTKTKAGRRWVPVPAALLEQLPVGIAAGSVAYDVRKACRAAGIRELGTHAFRRRRISLWYAQNVDGPQVARWAGHSKASESMDTYAYEVMDAYEDEWLAFWANVRGGAAVKEPV